MVASNTFRDGIYRVAIDRSWKTPHRRVTPKLLPPQPLGDLLRPTIVVELVGDHIPQP